MWVLKIGDTVKQTGPPDTRRMGRIGVVMGYGLKDMRDGRECYWVKWDGSAARNLYHINFLEKIYNQSLHVTEYRT